MPHRFAALLVLAALLMVAGCETTESQMAPEEVPANVMAAFKKQFPDAKLILCEKELYKDGTVHYEFEFKIKDGEREEAEYNAEGVLLSKH